VRLPGSSLSICGATPDAAALSRRLRQQAILSAARRRNGVRMPARASNTTPDNFLHQPMRIKDQCHSAVAQNGGAGYKLHLPVEPSQALDDRLMVAQNLVNNEAVTPILSLGHHDLLSFGALGVYIEEVPEPDIWNKFLANICDMLAVGLFNVLSRQFDAFKGVGQWKHEEVLPDPHLQSVDDGHREWQTQCHSGSRSEFARDVDSSAQRLHFLMHHVHANSTAGDVGHLTSR